MSEPTWCGDPEALLAHAGWVRSLARSLVVDPSLARDVEQEAWLGVLERPPAHAGNLTAWLGTVVRNTARQLGRREGRRVRREERASGSDCTRPTAELVLQAEMQREVVSTVLELDEPYRTTILLRYWRDLAPQEIARMQGVSAGTVRSRIHRAHAELRARLDRSTGGDRGAWSAVLCAWIRAGGGAKTAGVSSASALFTGAVAMGWKLTLGLVVVVGGLVAWRVLHGDSELSAGDEVSRVADRDEARADSVPGSIAGASLARSSDPESRGGRAPALVAARSVQRAQPESEIDLGVLVGRVLDGETGEPLAGAVLATYGELQTTTDASGRYRLEGITTDVELPLYARTPGFAEETAKIKLRGPEETTVDFELRRGAPLVVEVFDRETGAAVAGASVHVDPRVAPFTRTDAEGRCELRILEGRECFLKVVAEGYYPFLWSYQVEDVGRALAPRVPLAPLGSIEGRVTDEAGNPIEGIDVHVRSAGQGFGPGLLSKEEREALDLPGFAGPDPLHASSARTDEAGVFRVSALPGATPLRVVAVRSDGRSVTSDPVQVESSRAQHWVELVFRAGATVRGRVLFNGESRAGVRVSWEPSGEGHGAHASTDRQGLYELGDVRPGAVTLRVSSDLLRFGPLPEVELVVEAGETYEQELAWSAELSRLSGRVVSESGEPLAGVPVEATLMSAAGRWPRFEATTADDGSYSIAVRATEAYAVSASLHTVERSRTGVLAGSMDVDLVLPVIGALPVRLVEEVTGEPVELLVDGFGLSWRMSGDASFERAWARLDAAGSARVHLPVGSVDLSVHLHELGYAPALVRRVQVTEGQASVPVVIRLARGLEARFAFSNESDVPPVSLGSHKLFLLSEAQLPLLRGPFPHGDPRSNYSMSFGDQRVDLWVGDRALLHQELLPDDRGRAHLSSLARGRTPCAPTRTRCSSSRRPSS